MVARGGIEPPTRGNRPKNTEFELTNKYLIKPSFSQLILLYISLTASISPYKSKEFCTLASG